MEKLLVDHKCADMDLLAGLCTCLDLLILSVKIGDKFGAIMSAVALRGEDKPDNVYQNLANDFHD